MTSLPSGQFVEGFSLRDSPVFDDWVRFQREYWHLHINEVFYRLFYLQFAAGELASAIETVSCWLTKLGGDPIAPCGEALYVQLPFLHFHVND